MTGIRYIALSALFSACFFLSVSAGKAETFVYAVKGTDTLRADLYRAPLLHSALHSENGDSIPGFRSEGAPCMLFMFGGGFYTGERDAAKYSGFFEFLNSLGYSVVSIDYRLGLAPLVSATEKPTLGGLIKLLSQSVDMAVEDLYSATAFLIEQGRELGIDSRRIVVCGSSAGAISVLTGQWRLPAARTDGILPPEFEYAGVISFAGAIFSTQGAPKPYHPSCPILFFHGSADSNVPYKKLAIGKIGFYGPAYLTPLLDKSETPYYRCDFEDFDHRIATTPMDSNREQIASFLEYYVGQNRKWQINETVRDLLQPAGKGHIGIGDYIRSNFSTE